MRVLIPLITFATLTATVLAQSGNTLQVDPKTGRVIGAKEISAEELQRHIDSKTKMLIIDVRDDAQFEKETIKGAVHISMEQLPERLKQIPVDTLLAFT